MTGRKSKIHLPSSRLWQAAVAYAVSKGPAAAKATKRVKALTLREAYRRITGEEPRSA